MHVTLTHSGLRRRSLRLLRIAGCILVLALMVGVALLHHFWPFTEAAVRSNLSEAFSANVRFGSFHHKYFPPGCIAENVVFQRDEDGAPLAEIRRLTITSGPGGLLRHHVSLFRAEGMQVTVATKGLGQNHLRKQTTIDKFVADDAVLEIPRKGLQPSLCFVFHSFRLHDLNGPGITKFAAVFANPLPAGIIRTSGQFGPWNSSDPSATPVSGNYSLENADLVVFHSIAGLVSSKGDFSGTFKQLAVEGHTQTPKFVVAKTGHGVPLDTHFSATVNAIKGDVTLNQVAAHFGKDSVTAKGTIARRDDGKRSVILDLTCDRGRIEDTFYPFIRSPKSPLAGDVAFRMHVVLPSGHEPFMKKLQLDSNFQIQNARFTSPKVETRVSLVSSPPNRDETGTLADFQGSVTLNNGIAQFTNLSVHDDGAAALLSGNYDLTDQKVNLHGKLKTEASLAKTTHGIKAVFAKAIEPFFKKKPHQTVVPVHVGGTYSHPNFGLDLGS
jgi:AsmA-like C-terminal region